MRVLLTGAAGFVGHHILNYLVKRTNWDVVGLVRCGKIGTCERLRDLDLPEGRVQIVWHDLRSPINEYVAREIGEVDHVIHAAAETHVDRSIDDPMCFAMANVIGTVNLLNYCRERGLRGWYLQFSTDEIFGTAMNGHAFAETEAPMPSNPYSATKVSCEQFVRAYETTYGLKGLVVRPVNIYGERQNPEKFIPKLVGLIRNGLTVKIHADLQSGATGYRKYIYAENVAKAIHFLLSHGPEDLGGKRVFHITSDTELNNIVLANMVAEIIGNPLHYELVDFHRHRPGHDFRYTLSDTNMKSLGWELDEDFPKMLEKTVWWYLDHPKYLG